MLARGFAGSVVGVSGQVIQVEVDLSRGLPGVTIVGLPDASIQESRERIRSAIRNSGLEFPLGRITVNLAPAVLRKVGGVFDLAIACAILAASEQLPSPVVAPVLCGELGLDGSVRPVRGILALAADLPSQGHRELIVPLGNGAEAAVVPGLTVRAARTLGEVVAHLAGKQELAPIEHVSVSRAETEPALLPDLADVSGQPTARRALEVAAAGHHNLLFVGPPGSGKTMLANRLASILPPLSFEEAMEVTRIHSVAGVLRPGEPWVGAPPVRAPHHTTSEIAVVGGGPRVRPGEVSLAHRGVLLLDELPEFRRSVLEALRQPLVEGEITVSRANASHRFPASFCLVATMNPCPCGFRGDDGHECRCRPMAIQRYRSRISGPLLDRMDIVVDVPRVRIEDLQGPIGEPSARVAARVAAARARQAARAAHGFAPMNARLTPGQVRAICPLGVEARRHLLMAARLAALSARAHESILRVARTIADLAGEIEISVDHVSEAIEYRRSTIAAERVAA